MIFKIGYLFISGLLLQNMMFSEDQIIKAPDFNLVSGDHKSISLSELRTKVIICFYETKDTADKNNELKNELRQFQEGLNSLSQKTLFVLAVADCSQAFWPFIGFWESALIDRSKNIGYILYGDWNGKMRENYHFIKDEANFAVIDKNGSVRYQIHGKTKPDEINHIKNIISSLLSESDISNQ